MPCFPFGRYVVQVRIPIVWGLYRLFRANCCIFVYSFFVCAHFFTNFASENQIERPVIRYMTAPSPNDDGTLPNFSKCALYVVWWENCSRVIVAVSVSSYLFFLKTLSVIITWVWRNVPDRSACHCWELHSGLSCIYANTCYVNRCNMLLANISYILK